MATSRRPPMITTQLTVRAAALVVLVLLMDSPPTSIAQLTYEEGVLWPFFSESPPPPSTFAELTSEQGTVVSPVSPPVLSPPASQNLTPPPPPPQPSPSLQQQSVNATSLAPPSPAPPSPAPAYAVPERWADKYPASDFRHDTVPPRFALWPENLPYVKFVYFCQQELIKPKRNLRDFKYKQGEGKLQTRPYFDLGLVDRHNMPYFRHWKIDWKVDIHRIVCPVVCEYTDLQRLYQYRLRRNVLGAGFGSGMAALAILELAVMVFIIFLWAVNPDQVRRRVGATEDQTLKEFLWDWFKNLEYWTDSIPDWIHLVLLCMVGFAMMEGAGHSNFFEWRSMLFYNTGVAYSYLTLSAMLSSFLYQCALFLQSRKPAAAAAQVTHSSSLQRTAQPTLSNSVSRTASKRTPQLPTTADDELKNSVKELWTDDWKYQRIFGQVGVLVLMGMYLLSVDDYDGKSMDSLASVIVGAIIVACLWSLAVATVVAIRSLRRIITICTLKPMSVLKP